MRKQYSATYKAEIVKEILREEKMLNQLVSEAGHPSHATGGMEEASTGEMATGVQISMDDKGCALDNIFTERLWRTLKYEEVYLHEYNTPRDAFQWLGAYFTSITISGSSRVSPIVRRPNSISPDPAFSQWFGPSWPLPCRDCAGTVAW